MRPGGQPNLQQLMKQAQKMQQQLAQAQAELAETEVVGTAGDAARPSKPGIHNKPLPPRGRMRG